MDINFKNKTILITGGGSGLGMNIVRAFASYDANVAFTYNNSKSQADELIKQIGKDNVKAYQFDISKIDTINSLLDQIINDFGNIDVLVNNAGIYPGKLINDINEKDFEDMMNINSKGVFFLSRSVAQIMKNGSIINISSINANNPGKTLAHYGMSKASIEMLTKSLALEYGPNIRVNCIAPGLIHRDGIENAIPSWVDSYGERALLKRLVNPEDIANTCVFFASDLSAGITGQTLTVDCGVSIAPYYNND